MEEEEEDGEEGPEEGPRRAAPPTEPEACVRPGTCFPLCPGRSSLGDSKAQW